MSFDPDALTFVAEIISWRGPAPFVFADIPDDFTATIRHAAQVASYGWGMVPVRARIAEVEFATSLFRRGDGYVLPIKLAVQRTTGLCVGDCCTVLLRVGR